MIEPAQPGHADQFVVERSFEQRFPHMASHLPTFVQGYERSVDSARAILAFLQAHFQINTALAREIEARCVHPEVDGRDDEAKGTSCRR